VLDPDVIVVQRLRLGQRELKALLGTRRERDVAAGIRARQKLGVVARARWQAAVAAAATAAARPLGQRALLPDWTSAPAGGILEGPGQRVWAERRFDPTVHNIEVDANGSQRLPVEVAKAGRPSGPPDGAQNFRLDAFGRDAVVT
jgi:hypothetical protein